MEKDVNFGQRMNDTYAAACFPPRPRDAHKGLYGYIALAGGSLSYSGAPRLAALGATALRCGAGVVMMAVPGSLCPLMVPLILESTLYPLSEDATGHLCFREQEWQDLGEKARVIAFGMGAGRTEEIIKILDWLLAHYTGRLIVDADGLWALARLGLARGRQAAGRLLLTPHLGEAARLLECSVQDIQAEPFRAARDMALACGGTVLLKGRATYITDGGEGWICDRGCPGMATAGSGDVLSGVAAALLAREELSIPHGAAAAAYICGLAGEEARKDWGDAAMLAGDTATRVGQVVRRLEAMQEAQGRT